ncbi:MAG TPA: hypothetical protein VEW28_08520 [Candidatus Kapabacteria bacterium]|nr:hypothetical protein [Candidatus Kapabacteria bacterium]
MKTQYMNNVPFLPGELTIVTSDHAEATMQHSARLADSFRKARLNVLVINCGMNERRFRQHYHDTYGSGIDTTPTVILKTSLLGNVAGDREGIDQIVREAKIGVVILAGWEFASGTRRRRNKLFFYLRELMAERDIAVIVYSQTMNNPVAGKMGALGKLAAAAMEVVKIDSSKVLEAVVKKPPVIAWESADEMHTIEQGVQRLVRNINELADHQCTSDEDARQIENDDGDYGVAV